MGSVALLTEAPSTETPIVDSPFTAIPERARLFVAWEFPDRWHVETRVPGWPGRAVCVVAGDQIWSGVFDATGGEGVADTRVVPAIPAIVVEMVDPSRLERRLELVCVGDTVQADRPCLVFRGTVRNPDDIFVWPANSHEILLDPGSGVLLKVEANFRGVPYATAEFSRITYNAEFPADMFRGADLATPQW